MAGEDSSPPFRQSPYSPFPFGSPLGMSDRSATNLTNGRPRSSLNLSTNNASSLAMAGGLSATFNSSILKGGDRVRVQEAYGGNAFVVKNFLASDYIKTTFLYYRSCHVWWKRFYK